MVTNSHVGRPLRNLALHPGINFSKLDVGGDVGGFVFTVGSVVVVLIGLPALLPMYLSSLVLGVSLAIGLGAWYRHHPKH